VSRHQQHRGDDALQRNASDEEQIARAKRLEAKQRSEELADLKMVLASPSGRRVFWRLMEWCGLGRTVYHPTGSQMNINVGMQNAGLFMQSEIVEADEDAYFTMQREARQRAKALAVENESVRMPSAEDGIDT